MKKSSFVALVLGTIGGLLFSLGMCMALIPEWNAFKPGVIMCAAGIVVLLFMVMIWRKMTHKKRIRLSGRIVGGILVGIIGLVLLGVGMCLVLLWDNMVLGILIGIVGIVVLLFMIPVIKGLK